VSVRLPRGPFHSGGIAAAPHDPVSVSPKHVLPTPKRLAQFPFHYLVYDADDRPVGLHHATQAHGAVVVLVVPSGIGSSALSLSAAWQDDRTNCMGLTQRQGPPGGCLSRFVRASTAEVPVRPGLDS
jgi:hypothetical protein